MGASKNPKARNLLYGIECDSEKLRDFIGTRHEAARFFRAELARRGIAAQGSDYIVPVLLGDDRRALQVAETLRAAGHDIRAIRPPTVAEGTARLRISIHADHTIAELQTAADAVVKALK